MAAGYFIWNMIHPTMQEWNPFGGTSRTQDKASLFQVIDQEYMYYQVQGTWRQPP